MPNTGFWPVLVMLVTLLLAPVAALAHSEGHDHSEPAQSVSVDKPRDSQTGIVRWTDDAGRVHYSQELNNVPEQFRSRAVPLGQPAPSSPEAATSR